MRSVLATTMLLAGAMLLAGCNAVADGKRPVVTVEPPAKSTAWLTVASAKDEERIANVTGAWAAGLAAAQSKFPTAIRDEGQLLQQNAALARPAPTPGSYRCRMIALGSTKPGEPAFRSYNPFFCYIEAEASLLTIVKQTGSKRPAGRLWEDDDPDRLIFLGSLALGSEDEILAYGEDPQRDMAGIFERVGPFRWRLVIPWPQDGSKLQIFELTPVEDQPE